MEEKYQALAEKTKAVVSAPMYNASNELLICLFRLSLVVDMTVSPLIWVFTSFPDSLGVHWEKLILL